MSQLKYWNGTAWVTAVVGAQGPQGDEGIVAQAEAPTNTDVLWLDTDDVSPPFGVNDIPELPQTKTTNLVTDLGARVQTAHLQGLLNQTSVVVETVLRQNLTANSMFSGNMIYCFFTPLVTVTVSQITMASGGTAGTGATTTSMGLFTVNSSDQPLLVARTAVDTTLFQATNTVYTRSFDTGGGYPATYTLVAGTRYAVGVNSSGGTTITLSSTTSSSANGAVLALAPRIAGVNGGTAGLPTTLQTGLINVNFCVWARLS